MRPLGGRLFALALSLGLSTWWVTHAQSQPQASKTRDGGVTTTSRKKRDDNFTQRREEHRRRVSSLMAGMFASGASSNTFGPGGLGTGNKSALGGLSGGAGVGDAEGVGGLRSRGAVGLRGGTLSHDVKFTLNRVRGIGGSDVERILKRHQGEVAFCRDTATSGAPVYGFKATIDPSGSVAEAEADAPDDLADCITACIRRWKFPEVEKPASIDFSTHFSPRIKEGMVLRGAPNSHVTFVIHQFIGCNRSDVEETLTRHQGAVIACREAFINGGTQTYRINIAFEKMAPQRRGGGATQRRWQVHRSRC